MEDPPVPGDDDRFARVFDSGTPIFQEVVGRQRFLTAVNTDERLKALAEGKHMTIVDSRNLADALHFIQHQRIKHQCEQILRGEKVSNFLNPRDLPKMAKEQLRDAFTIIDEAQSAVRQTYRAGMG